MTLLHDGLTVLTKCFRTLLDSRLFLIQRKVQIGQNAKLLRAPNLFCKDKHESRDGDQAQGSCD